MMLKLHSTIQNSNNNNGKYKNIQKCNTINKIQPCCCLESESWSKDSQKTDMSKNSLAQVNLACGMWESVILSCQRSNPFFSSFKDAVYVCSLLYHYFFSQGGWRVVVLNWLDLSLSPRETSHDCLVYQGMLRNMEFEHSVHVCNAT